MKIVIPLGRESAWHDNELRYALRSYEKYMPHTGIVIVGHLPQWIKGVEHVVCNDIPGRRAYSIARKVYTACDVVTDDFIFSNDDIFALTHISAIEAWYDMEMQRKLTRDLTDAYKRKVKETADALPSDALFYDIHTPCVIKPRLFQEVMDAMDYSRHEYVMKSLYLNSTTVRPVQMDDCKIKYAGNRSQIVDQTESRIFFSIGDSALTKAMKQYLDELYPEKCKYET